MADVAYKNTIIKIEFGTIQNQIIEILSKNR